MNLRLFKALGMALGVALPLASQSVDSGNAVHDSVATQIVETEVPVVVPQERGDTLLDTLVDTLPDTNVVVEIPTPSHLESAYLLYLDGRYPQSYALYQEHYLATGEIVAYYGMINALTMQKLYTEALALCHAKRDTIIVAKEVWISALQGDKKRANYLADSLQSSVQPAAQALLLRSGGDGYYVTGDYKEAAEWYRSAEVLEHDSATAKALVAVEKAQKEVVKFSVDCMGGPIVYSDEVLDDNGFSYRYNSGSYFDGGLSWNIREKQRIRVRYNRFNVDFATQTEGSVARYQNTFYTDLRVRGVNEKPLLLGGSMQLFFSDMQNLNQGFSAQFFHGSTVKERSTFGARWFGTFTEAVTSVQLTPLYVWTHTKFALTVQPTLLWSPVTPNSVAMETVQFSGELTAGYTGNVGEVSGTIMVGDRLFVADGDGQNITTITLPHQFTGMLYGSLTLGKSPVALTTLLRYEQYEQLSRLIALAGVTLTF